MKSFHKTMGLLSGIFLLMIILSITVASSYISRNNISLNSLFEGSTSYNYGSEWNFSFDGLFSPHHQSSEYEKVIFEQTDTFSLPKELFISSSIEEIEFIEEDRSDIKIDFYRERPDTDSYTIKYKTSASSDKLSITASMTSRNLTINKDYKGKITVHVPIDYIFDKVTLDSGATKIQSSNIYTNTNELAIIADFGDINIVLDQPINIVNVACNFGSLYFENAAPINDLSITCDMGSVKLILNGEISKLHCDNNMGDVSIEATTTIASLIVGNDMGKIDGKFLENVKKVDIETNMGTIDVSFYENDSMEVYAKTDLGSVNSDYDRVSSKSKSDFSFISDMGSITISKK